MSASVSLVLLLLSVLATASLEASNMVVRHLLERGDGEGDSPVEEVTRRQLRGGARSPILTRTKQTREDERKLIGARVPRAEVLRDLLEMR